MAYAQSTNELMPMLILQTLGGQFWFVIHIHFFSDVYIFKLTSDCLL